MDDKTQFDFILDETFIIHFDHYEPMGIGYSIEKKQIVAIDSSFNPPKISIPYNLDLDNLNKLDNGSFKKFFLRYFKINELEDHDEQNRLKNRITDLFHDTKLFIFEAKIKFDARSLIVPDTDILDRINASEQCEKSKQQINNFVKLNRKNDQDIIESDYYRFYLEKDDLGTHRQVEIIPSPKSLDERTAPTHKTLEKFVTGYTPSFKETYEKTLAKINEYLYHIDTIPLKIVALTSMSSYYPEIFNCFPYLDFYSATAGSGKTNWVQLTMGLSYLGNYVTNPSPAIIYRYTHIFNNATGIDELDKLLKSEQKYQYHSIINSGYKKGAVIPRCSQDNYNEIEQFNVFGFKVWSRLESIPDDLLSRAISIHLVKNSGQKKLKSVIFESDLSDIRDDNYLLRLLENDRVREVYTELQEIDVVFDRLKEIYLPILTIAKLVDNELFLEMINYVRSIQQEKILLDVDENLLLVMQILNDLQVCGTELKTTDLRDEFRDRRLAIEEYNEYQINKFATPQKMDKLLERLGFKPGMKNRKINTRYIDKRIFDQQARIYLPEKFESAAQIGSLDKKLNSIEQVESTKELFLTVEPIQDQINLLMEQNKTDSIFISDLIANCEKIGIDQNSVEVVIKKWSDEGDCVVFDNERVKILR